MANVECPEVTVRAPGFVIAASRHTFVSIHDGPASLETVRAESEHARTRMAREPESVACVVVLGPAVPPPSTPVRAAIAQLFVDIAPSAAGLAMVVEPRGFQGAVLRAMFTSYLTLARFPYPTRVFDSVLDAFEWFAPRLPLDPIEVTKRIATLRG